MLLTYPLRVAILSAEINPFVTCLPPGLSAGRRRQEGVKNMPNKFSNFFRLNAAAVITDGEGRVLAFERADQAGSWQCAQGGCNDGEAFLDCFYRELKEETEIPRRFLKLLAEYPSLLLYEFPKKVRDPKKGRGQAQKWFVFRLAKGGTKSIDFNGHGKPEFRAWKWTTMKQLTREVVPFKRDIYKLLCKDFSKFLK